MKKLLFFYVELWIISSVVVVQAAFVLLSVANATVVFSPIPQQTWWKPAGFRRSQQHLALYYKLHGSRGWWQSYRSLVFVKAPRVVEGQHEDGWGKLRKHSLFSSTALAHSKSEGGICGGGMVGVQQQQLASQRRIALLQLHQLPPWKQPADAGRQQWDSIAAEAFCQNSRKSMHQFQFIDICICRKTL